MLNVRQFREQVIRPTLHHLDLWTLAAEDLLVGTAAVESRLGTYLVQVGGGPAKGVYQMEPTTEKDIWVNYLPRKGGLGEAVGSLLTAVKDVDDLVGNLFYATAMARVHYLRVPAALPLRVNYDTQDEYVHGMAYYWKTFYNTEKGAGEPIDFVNAWYDHVEDMEW